MRRRKTTILINEDRWSCYLYGPEEYAGVVSDDEEECAETDVEKKRISFRSDKFDLATVVHEVFHALWSYTSFPTGVTVTSEHMEETAAKVIESNYLKLLSKSVTIYNKLAAKEHRLASNTTKKVQQVCRSLSELAAKKP